MIPTEAKASISVSMLTHLLQDKTFLKAADELESTPELLLKELF